MERLINDITTMLTYLVIASIFACALGAPADPNERIVGGTPVHQAVIPWQVSLVYNNTHKCGGAIVNGRYIVTAAHCVYGILAKDLLVRSNATSWRTGGELSPVGRVITHELYSGTTPDYDIGLLELKNAMQIGPGARPIPLVKKDQPLTVGAEALVSGWGATHMEGEFSSTLMRMYVPIINQEQCKVAYNGTITPRMFCAGVPGEDKDVCEGDAGGPVVLDDVLVGIVSVVKPCGISRYAGIYTNVAALREWLDKQTA